MNRLIAFIIGMLLIVIAGMGYWVNSLQTDLEISEGEVSIYKSRADSNKVWKDDAGQWRNKATVAQANTDALKEMIKNGDPELLALRQEVSALKKDMSNLISYTKVQAQTISEIKGSVRDTIIRVIKGNDTIQQKQIKVSASNEWNSYDITIEGDTATIKREGKEEFDQVVYWERLTKKGKKIFWPFGKRTWSSEIISKNPETKIVKQSTLLVKRK